MLQRLDGCLAGDGGTPDAPPASDGGPAPFPGCDPTAESCDDGMTCEVRCGTKTAACAASGAGFHGTTCASSADCEPGAQPPIGWLFGLPTFMDESLFDDGQVTFQAGNHREAVTMSFMDYYRLAKPAVGHFGQERRKEVVAS